LRCAATACDKSCDLRRRMPALTAMLSSRFCARWVHEWKRSACE
jgi:hypothetical protein